MRIKRTIFFNFSLTLTFLKSNGQGNNAYLKANAIRVDNSIQLSDSIFYPIEDAKNVNVRRAKVGLPPMEEYGKYFGIDYKLPNKQK